MIAGEAATVDSVSRSPPGASVRVETEAAHDAVGVALDLHLHHGVGVVRVLQEAEVGVAHAGRGRDAVAEPPAVAHECRPSARSGSGSVPSSASGPSLAP